MPQAPFAPSPDAAWSMVIMPDTQNYVKWAEYQSLLPKITEWIRDNRDALQDPGRAAGRRHRQQQQHEQSFQRRPDEPQQWPAAQAGMFVLNGHVPYIMAAGNHDFGFTNAENRDTMVNNYFQAVGQSAQRSGTRRHSQGNERRRRNSERLLRISRRPMAARC